MATPWDDTIKKLIQLDPAAFVRLILPQAHFIETVSPLLEQEQLEMDGLLLIEINGQLYLLNIEFQTYYDALMAERLLRYNILAKMQRKLPVVSCVIHLLDDTPLHPSPATWEVAGMQEQQTFPYYTIELSQYTPQDLISVNEVSLLPLLPFTKGGRSREEITRMFHLIEQETERNETGKHALELIGFTFASLILEKKQSSELEWLIRRFHGMYNVLQDTPIFREIRRIGHEEGRVEGRQEGLLLGLRSAVVLMVEARFGELKPLAQRQVEQITSEETLNKVLIRISVAQSLEEAGQALLDWKKNA